MQSQRGTNIERERDDVQRRDTADAGELGCREKGAKFRAEKPR